MPAGYGLAHLDRSRMSETTVTLERKSRYEFTVRIDGVEGGFNVDEGAPLGEGNGPSPDALLGAATGGCLASSLLFCLEKAHVAVDALTARIEVGKVRDERGRVRIGSMNVVLAAKVAQEHHERFERCRTLFEDYCVVTQSVRSGIPVEVDVSIA